MTTAPRLYARLFERLGPIADPFQSMHSVVDALWAEFNGSGISWVGFYLANPQNPAELVLGPRRDKPACSPIGLHGVCGRAFVSRRTVVVKDVAVMGPNYIACDPRDRSEIVVPCLRSNGSCWGVLDVDSHQIAAFDMHDAASLQSLLQATGLTSIAQPIDNTVEVL